MSRLALLAMLVLVPTKPFGSVWSGADVGSDEQSQLGRHSTFARAAYLDDVGQMSHVMSEFIELLLEKVTFLADIVIESALNEDCEPSCVLVANKRQQNNNADGITNKSTGSNKDRLNGGTSATSIGQDSNEFRQPQYWANLWLTKGSSEALSGRAADNSAQEAPPGPDREQGCSLFGLSVAREDLPVVQMESCCREIDRCYSGCDNLKPTCDTNFRRCLKSMCELKFDYNNDSLVRQSGLSMRRRRDAAPNWSQYELLADDLAGSQPQPDEPELDEELLYASLPAWPNNGRNQADWSSNVDGNQQAGSTSRLLRRQTGNASMISGDGSSPGEPERSPFSSLPPPPIEPTDEQRLRKQLKDKYKACKLASKVLIIGNLAFTCQRYRQIQRVACCAKQL